ncbi:MAG TPA: transporter [Planctomycetota bacterium]|jgi:hypothetical protein
MANRVAYLLPLVLWAAVAAGEDGNNPPTTKRESNDEVGPEHGKLNTDDPSVIGPQHVQLEFLYAFSIANRAFDNSRGTRRRGTAATHLPAVLFTVGVVPDLDLRLHADYHDVHDNRFEFKPGVRGPESGNNIGDTALNARYRFLNREALGLEVAYVAGATAPTGSRSRSRELGSGQGFWSVEQELVATKDWGRWTTNAEMGYSQPINARRTDPRGALTANLATGFQVLKWLQPEVELNYRNITVRRGSGAEVLAATAGLVMPLNQGLRIMAGVQQALTGRNQDQVTRGQLSIQLSW